MTDKNKKKNKRKTFRPKDGEIYYSVEISHFNKPDIKASDVYIKRRIYGQYPCADAENIMLGNCFKFETEAKENIDYIIERKKKICEIFLGKL
jgi:hypothetical protein